MRGVVVWLLATASGLLAAPVLLHNEATGTSDQFALYWNVDESKDPAIDVTAFEFLPRNYTQVGNGCSNPGCGSWTQGLWPTIKDDGTPINGGVPQAANLTAHLEAIRETLPKWIPDPNWQGNAVYDFEAWTTVWDLNVSPDNWHGQRYRDYSVKLVKEAHPSWNSSEIEAAAKAAFEKAATEWFVESLLVGRELRPQARWGFYGLPANHFTPCTGQGSGTKCGYDGPNGALWRSHSDQQLPIWQASTALFPSIYISTSMSNIDLAHAYISSTVTETVRCATMVNSSFPLPVFSYAWHYFHNGQELLPVSYVTASLQGTALGGAQGVVVWGGSHLNASYWDWLNNTGGPVTKRWCDVRGGCAQY